LGPLTIATRRGFTTDTSRRAAAAAVGTATVAGVAEQPYVGDVACVMVVVSISVTSFGPGQRCPELML
jgi:hypothetical protein